MRVGKRLVLCCDGTWNTPDRRVDGHPCPTNVTKIALSVAARSRGVRQVVYYHPGVGTGRWGRLAAGVFGWGLSGNVQDAYQFLVDNYEPDDELFLFGFSRGAYTVRSLAGLVRNSGILRRGNAHRVGEAWSLYRNSADEPGGVAATLFRRTYSHEPRIRFIGVWDTVGALGVPILGPRWFSPVGRWLNRHNQFHDTQLSARVDGAFHALAIDEHRGPFEPTLWHQQPDATGQVLKQVWFRGAHCDVGGGSADTCLSDITLLWMAERAREYGLAFSPGVLSARGQGQAGAAEGVDFVVTPRVMGEVHDSRTGFWRLVGRCRRPIGVAASREDGKVDGREYVAASARDRLELGDGYWPPNLVDYLSQPEAHVEPVPEQAWPAGPGAGGRPRPNPIAMLPRQGRNGPGVVARPATLATPGAAAAGLMTTTSPLKEQ